MLERVRAVFFDFNGTLIDNSHVSYRGECHVFEEFGISPPGFQEMCRTSGPPYLEWYRSYGIDASEETLSRLFWEGAQALSHQPLFDDVAASLGRLRSRDLLLGIVSGTRCERVSSRFHQAGILGRLQFIIGQCRSKVKPILAMCEEFSLDPDRVLYVGDSITDMRDASLAGAVPVGITRYYGTESALVKSGAVACVSDLAELCAFV